MEEITSNPAESFGQIIAGIDNPRDVYSRNLFLADRHLYDQTRRQIRELG